MPPARHSAREHPFSNRAVPNPPQHCPELQPSAFSLLAQLPHPRRAVRAQHPLSRKRISQHSHVPPPSSDPLRIRPQVSRQEPAPQPALQGVEKLTDLGPPPEFSQNFQNVVSQNPRGCLSTMNCQALLIYHQPSPTLPFVPYVNCEFVASTPNEPARAIAPGSLPFLIPGQAEGLPHNPRARRRAARF
jgi:hypothetical protein